MKTSDQLLKIGTRTLLMEAEALRHASGLLGESFIKSVECILKSQGRVIVTGIGKSAIVGQKIVATFNSTGTPSIFMHAADAIHGDLGIIQKHDIVLCISNSGSTAEIKALIPLVKNLGNTILSITGNLQSYLGIHSDWAISSYVEKEACTINLAPTSSTTVQMALGDALANALMESKGFKAEDFAQFHPGGSLGKALLLKVSDLVKNQAFPAVAPDSNLAEIVVGISSGRKGAVVVMDGSKLIGIITDGDLRRYLGEGGLELKNCKAIDLASKNPKTTSLDSLAIEALNTMKSNKINQLIVVDNQTPAGILHIQEILSEGLL